MANTIDVGMIVQFGGLFVPENYIECNGQLLQVSTFQGLFSIIGPTYGGDGRSTFAVPDLRPVDTQGMRISYKAAKVPSYIICSFGEYPVWP